MNLLRKIDDKIIDLFDGITTKIQKKGLIPLNTLIMGFKVIFFGSIMSRQNTFGILDIFLLILCAGCLVVAYFAWADAIGYWENHRKTLSLNARVLLHRERNLVLRYAITIGFIPLTIIELIHMATSPASAISDATLVISDITLISIGYLECCRYIGPGEYSRKRKSSLQGLPKVG